MAVRPGQGGRLVAQPLVEPGGAAVALEGVPGDVEARHGGPVGRVLGQGPDLEGGGRRRRRPLNKVKVNKFGDCHA